METLLKITKFGAINLFEAVVCRFLYEPFYADFGPLNISCVYKYCKVLQTKLKDASLQGKRIGEFTAAFMQVPCKADTGLCACHVEQ